MTEQLVSQSELAEFLACSPRTVREYVQKGVLTDDCMKGRHYRLKECVKAVTTYLRDEASQHVAEDDDGETLNPTVENAKLNRAKTRQAEVATEKTEIERDLKAAQLEQLEGRLISMDDAFEVLALILTSAKSKLLSLANRLPLKIHRLDAEDMHIIKDEVYDVLIELAEDAQGFKQQTIANAELRMQKEGIK